MGTHKVYVRAEDERWLKEQGIDTGPWIRAMVRRSILVQHTRGTAHDPKLDEYRLNQNVKLTSDGGHNHSSDEAVVTAVETRISRYAERIIWLTLWLTRHDGDSRGALVTLAAGGLLCSGTCTGEIHALLESSRL